MILCVYVVSVVTSLFSKEFFRGLAVKLADNALEGLHARLHMVHRVAVVLALILEIEDLQAGLHFTYSGLVASLDEKILIDHLLEFAGKTDQLFTVVIHALFLL